MQWLIFIVSVINLIFTVLALIKIPQKNLLKNYFLTFSFINTLWLFTNFLLAKTNSFILLKLAYALGAITISTALMFVISFSMQKKLSLLQIFVINVPGFVFLIVSMTDLFYSLQGNRFQFTPLFNIYSIYIITSLILLIILMGNCIRNYQGIIHSQAKYILAGLLLFGSFSLFVSFILPIFGITQYIMLDTCGSLFFVLFTLYAMIKYHTLDIYLLFKKSTIYTTLIIFISGLYVAAIFILENLFQKFFGYYSVLSRIVAGFIIAVTFFPIKNKLESIIDKILFRERTEYINSLHEFSKSLITLIDLRKLMDSTANNIHRLLKVNRVCLMFLDKRTNHYQINALVGYHHFNRETLLSARNKLIIWLKHNQTVAIKDKFIKENKDNYYTPIIDKMNELKCSLVIPVMIKHKLLGIILLGEKLNDKLYSLEELNLLSSFGSQVAIAYSNAKTYYNLKKIYLGTIEAFIKAIEAKDIYTRGHSYRVVHIATKIAIEMGLSRDQIELLQRSGVLHDIGKIGIDNRILNKNSSLDQSEYIEIRKHPIIGNKIVSSVDFLRETANIILHHHEKWDGSGYPNQLKGESIPLLSRIICVADTFDAITSTRSYRSAKTDEDAIEEIKRCSGTQFDPIVVNAFINAYHKHESLISNI